VVDGCRQHEMIMVVTHVRMAIITKIDVNIKTCCCILSIKFNTLINIVDLLLQI